VNHPRESRRVGLARALSKLGLCSRTRGCELIRSGQVRLNGSITRNPESPVHMGKDRIEVNGTPIEAAGPVYLMMNKPRGVVTTASDEKGRKTVYAYLEKDLPWIGPVGRLDKASEGLLLLTNDSEWAAKLSAPETHLDKTYHVQIGARAEDAPLALLEKGVRTKDGGNLRVKQVRNLRGGEKNSWIEVVLDEGKNRQIRRIFEALEIEVLRLVRVSIGPLALGTLKKGEVRELSETEKAALDRAMSDKKAVAGTLQRSENEKAARSGKRHDFRASRGGSLRDHR
jgi:23S rRNA pseudouridine2605 synthase